MTATVCPYRKDSVTELQQTPGGPGVSIAEVIHISLHGDGAGAVSKCKNVRPEEETSESIAST